MEIWEINNQKFNELVQIAVQNATGNGPQSDRQCLVDAFKDYCSWHGQQVDNGKLAPFGRYSDDWEYLACYIFLELGNGTIGRRLVEPVQWAYIREILDDIASRK